MTGLLEGRHALVTGAGRGIGAAIALKFAQAGADVALAARSASQLEEVKAQIEKLGRKALVIPTDMGNRRQVLSLVDSALAGFGGIDVVVSNAGMSGPFEPLRDVSAEAWRAVQQTNLEGPLTMLQALAPHLMAKRSGSVIMVASIRGLNGVPWGAPYAHPRPRSSASRNPSRANWGRSGFESMPSVRGRSTPKCFARRLAPTRVCGESSPISLP